MLENAGVARLARGEACHLQTAHPRSDVPLPHLPTLAEVRRGFDRRSSADYIESVSPNDIELQKIGNQITLSASWTKTLHLVGNVSLLLEFEATATR